MHGRDVTVTSDDSEPKSHAGHIHSGWRLAIHNLYYGESPAGRWFRIGLLVFDLITVVYFVVSSTMVPSPHIDVVDFILGLLLTIELGARWSIANNPWRFSVRFGTIVDLLVIFSLLSQLLIDNLAFLRVVRMLRLMRSYHVMAELRRYWPWFKRHEDVIQSAVNLIVFIFVITALVYVVEGHTNPQIRNYVDALYFTVTTLTTTGFGDITMEGSTGRLLSVAIMVFGVALFLRLIQTIFRPPKIHNRCPGCGLDLHESDAVHCKRCGEVLRYRAPDIDA